MQERLGGRLPLEVVVVGGCTVVHTGKFEGHVQDALKLRGERKKSIIN